MSTLRNYAQSDFRPQKIAQSCRIGAYDSGHTEGPAAPVYAILFLFFQQLLTDFVGGIYGYGVLGTGIPVEMAALVLFLAPFRLLFFWRGRVTSGSVMPTSSAPFLV